MSRSMALGIVYVAALGAASVVSCGGSEFSSKPDASNNGGQGSTPGGGSASNAGTSSASGSSSGGKASSGSGSGGSPATAGSSSAGTNGQAGSSSGGNANGGNGNAGSANAGAPTHSDCEALIAEAREALSAAQRCLPGGIIPECQSAVKGLCCPEIIANEDSEAGQRFIAAIAALSDANCPVACPAIPCFEPSSGICEGDEVGTCIPGPTD